MTTVADAAREIEAIAPARLAEDWDNVGLLVGRPEAAIRRVMTCLTVTPTTVAEAVAEHADLVVAHHPMPFRPLKRLTDETTVGRLLLELIAARVAVYSAHTAFDSAALGINARLAQGISLRDVLPLLPADAPDQLEGSPPSMEAVMGTGRVGRLPEPIPLAVLIERLKAFLKIESLQCVGQSERLLQRVAIGCGAAGSLFDDAVRAGADCMVLGETNFHTCLEAEARDVALVMPGHYASERFAMERLADVLAQRLPGVDVWPSRTERDPVRSA